MAIAKLEPLAGELEMTEVSLQKPASQKMMKWQLKAITGELLLLQRHAQDSSCPCELSTEYEMCQPKHLLAIETYALETKAMTGDFALAELLHNIAGAADDLSRIYQEAPENKRPYVQIAEFARDARKELEPYLWQYKSKSDDEREVQPVPVLFSNICTGDRCFELPSGDIKLAMPAPFGWVGGKRLLVMTIVSLIPPHKTYVEPFAGAAWV